MSDETLGIIEATRVLTEYSHHHMTRKEAALKLAKLDISCDLDDYYHNYLGSNFDCTQHGNFVLIKVI